MPRNAEVIRQWSILRDLEASRRLTIDDLAHRAQVSTRTIRRDLEALQAAGFPLFDEVEEGKRYWRLERKAFRRLDDTGFTLAELSALYFSRALVECLSATPFRHDVQSAFDKLASALTPGMRQFLDRLPQAIQTKPEPGSHPVGAADTAGTDPKQAAAERTRVAQLLDATLHHRRVVVRYHSFSSNREKSYDLEPYRLVFAHGALYLVAFVPEYEQVRTFAVERIAAVSMTEERFQPADVDENAFAHSLGVHQGTPPERVELEFDPQVARHVRSRVWHTSQVVRDRTDGGAVVTLDVSIDRALRSWILGFGPLVRVTAPPQLAAEIARELERARAQYSPGVEPLSG